jgi:hypothetical protein
MTDHVDPSAAADAQRQPTVTFPAFVLSLVHTAAVHFGDVADPATGTPSPVNLAGAHQIIEILALLEQKTRGNLSPEERQMMEQVLYELRLRFVEVAGATPPPSAESRIILP